METISTIEASAGVELRVSLAPRRSHVRVRPCRSEKRRSKQKMLSKAWNNLASGARSREKLTTLSVPFDLMDGGVVGVTTNAINCHESFFYLICQRTCWLRFARRPWHLFSCLIDWRSLPPVTRLLKGLRDKFTSNRCSKVRCEACGAGFNFCRSRACMHNFQFTSCLWSHSEVAKIVFTLESHWFMAQNCRLKGKTRKCDRFWL